MRDEADRQEQGDEDAGDLEQRIEERCGDVDRHADEHGDEDRREVERQRYRDHNGKAHRRVEQPEAEPEEAPEDAGAGHVEKVGVGNQGRSPRLPRAPVPPADQHHAQVEHDRGNRDEVDDAGEAHDAAAEAGELPADPPVLDLHGQPGGDVDRGVLQSVVKAAQQRPVLADGQQQVVQPGHDLVGDADHGTDGHGQHFGGGEDQRDVEDGPQDVGHGEVAGQEGGDHADGQHGQPHQPVAEIGSQEESPVGIAQHLQDGVVADQREQQRDGVDGHGGQVLAQHDVEVAGRDGQQQLVGALVALLGPDAHGDGRDEDQHHEGEDFVELVEVGQVGVEEIVEPERRERANQHEQADEHVARGVDEIADEVPLENGV